MNSNEDIPAVTDYIRHQVVLHPEKFGYLGAYSRSMLRAEVSEDYAFAFDRLALSLTTSVLCGKTVSETPQVEYNFPANWWQHLKHAVSGFHGVLYAWWHGSDPQTGQPATPPPWLILLWPFLVLFPQWLGRHPVKWTKVTTDVHFEQRVLYPEVDHVPAEAGRPVIYETVSISYRDDSPPFGIRLVTEPSRFLDRYEIASRVYQDTEYGNHPSPTAFLSWLEHNGVNVNQLVKRRAR